MINRSQVALLSEYLGPVVLCVITVFKPLARIIIVILKIVLSDLILNRQGWV